MSLAHRPAARHLLLAAAVCAATALPVLGQERPRPLGPEVARPGAAPLPALVHLASAVLPSPVMRQAVTAFERMRESGLIDPSTTVTALVRGSTDRVRPLGTRDLPLAVNAMLGKSFRLALRQVQRREGCGGMFARLGANGAVLLATTAYLVPTGPAAEMRCRQGVAAFTHVGGSVTFLCPTFATLSRTEAATILIHEALHYAGLPERPGDPLAQSPREINHMVAASCGF